MCILGNVGKILNTKRKANITLTYKNGIITLNSKFCGRLKSKALGVPCTLCTYTTIEFCPTFTVGKITHTSFLSLALETEYKKVTHFVCNQRKRCSYERFYIR